MRVTWMAAMLLATGIPALPAELFGVFKSAELDARLVSLQKPEIIHQGSNFTISLNALSDVTQGARTNDDDADQVLFVRRGSGAILVAGRPHHVGAGDVISLPRKTEYQLSAPSGRVEYVAVRIWGEGGPRSPSFKVWSEISDVIPASEVEATFAGGYPHSIHSALAFLMAYAIYRGEWGPWESHQYQGHIYLVSTGHAEAELGGQIKDTREEGRGTTLGSGATGGQRYEIGPGDIVVIPPNTAHHMVLRGEKFGYLFILLRYP